MITAATRALADLPRPDDDVAQSTEARVTQDRAALLYGYGFGGLAISATASVVLAWMAARPQTCARLEVWLAVMAGVLALRALDLVVLHKRRRANRSGAAVDIGCFATGLLACACVWMAFPFLFYPSLSIAGRCSAAVILAAMAGGGVTVLAPCLPLACLHAVAMLLPSVVMLLCLPGREAHGLGGLALAMLAAMLVSSHTASQSVVTALRLTRVNQNLTAAAERHRAEAEAVQRQLCAAQTALDEANRSLERRIVARTADLEREIGERKHYAEALMRLASTDPLTGLCNRSHFAERLACMLADAERTGRMCAVLFLDLDNFKQINDARGHATGDHVLQAVSRLLNERAGRMAELARWGGDEFVVALPVENGAATAMALGHELTRVLTQPMQAGMETVRIGASIGVAQFPAHGRTQDELIRAADVAMYQAKREGRGRVAMFDRTLADGLTERHVLEQALRTAIERAELSLEFQPIVCARTGRCDALEALVRWTHPDRGVVGPADFIPVAEQSGQIAAIGRWVLQEAAQAAARWPARPGQDRPPAVTVNVSVAQVLSGTLIDDVAIALRATGLPAARLQLEITESMFVGDHVRVAPVFEELRRRGHRILLDDFGTGFSSLAYLGKLPLDVIKIDRSFVRGAERDGFAIINAILSIARALSLEVTAEGVETQLQRTVLTSIGVERLQGYLIGRPMVDAAIPAWLAANGHGVPMLVRAAVA